MQYTSQFQLQASTVVLDLLITSPLVISVMCVGVKLWSVEDFTTVPQVVQWKKEKI